MARILVVEDEVTSRELVRMHLETVGHTVMAAADGAVGLAAAQGGGIDLVIADGSMPNMDGFAMLKALRNSPATHALPVIFLSGLEDRESMRRAMSLGADDFITKPVTRQELLQAVEVRLARYESLRVTGGRGVALDNDTTVPPGANGTQQVKPRGGTLLHIGVRDAAMLVEGLNAAARREAAQLIQASVAEPIVAQAGILVSASAHRCVAFFEGGEAGASDHASRAARAALLAMLSARHLRTTLNARFAGHIGERFSIVAVLETGEIQLVARGNDMAAAGALMDDLAQVDEFLGSSWSIAMGAEALALTGREFVSGRTAAVVLASSMAARTFVEILGLDPRFEADGDFTAVRDAVISAIEENDDVAGPTLSRIVDDDAGAVLAGGLNDPTAGITGYHALQRLGEGGMSKVFLARHEESGERRVLKMVPIDDDEDLLQRFLQEYALVAQVRHPNVARIYEQGFGEHYAYIAMEFLSGGDLRARLDNPLPPAEALRYLTQIALGLTAIHHRGIIHRDLKPENLMFRDDGLLVLADFGIAKQLSTELTRTQHGEVYGTPFYMSPEQARGLTVDGRSDLYSLGIILYEMLTGAKPYNATRAEAVVYQHIHAPIPRLPAECASLQGLLESLLAKEVEDRFESALELMRVLRSGEPPAAAPAPRGILGRRRTAPSE